MKTAAPDWRVGSLFAGIGGFDYGLQLAGPFRTVWVAEQKPYRRKVLAKHFPDARQFRDVHHVHPRTAEPIDVLTGGVPCQDASDAGTRTGVRGARTGLWSQYARVLDGFRPSYAIIENVASLRRRGLGRVLQDLSALGYDAEWSCIPASAVGAHHPRDRIWIVAYPAGQPHRSGEGSGEPSARRRSDAPAGARQLADAEGQLQRTGLREDGPAAQRGGRPGDGGGPRIFDRAFRSALAAQKQDGWPAEPDVGRVAHGIPSRVDRLEALGDALVPRIVQLIGEAVLRDWHAYSGEHT